MKNKKRSIKVVALLIAFAIGVCLDFLSKHNLVSEESVNVWLAFTILIIFEWALIMYYTQLNNDNPDYYVVRNKILKKQSRRSKNKAPIKDNDECSCDTNCNC